MSAILMKLNRSTQSNTLLPFSHLILPSSPPLTPLLLLLLSSPPPTTLLPFSLLLSSPILLSFSILSSPLPSPTLSRWRAAEHLCEFSFHHPDMFKNKTVCELGKKELDLHSFDSGI